MFSNEGLSKGNSKDFINGIMGCIHVFRKGSYMVRIYTAAKRLTNNLECLTDLQAARRGVVVVSAELREHMRTLLTFLVGAYRCTLDLDEKYRLAIDTIVFIQNAGFDVRVHVCSAGCLCYGDPWTKLARAVKVPQVYYV